MIKYIMSKSLYQRAFIGIVACILIFILGYFILNHISTMEDPPLGNTIYILIGSALTFLPVLGIILIFKYLYDTKKKKERRLRRRKKHRLFFLKDTTKGQNI